VREGHVYERKEEMRYEERTIYVLSLSLKTWEFECSRKGFVCWKEKVS
jgi:hypothetical protein